MDKLIKELIFMNRFFIMFVSATLIGASGLFFYNYTANTHGLLEPTGPYTIGTATYHLVDSGRKEPHAPGADTPRELMVQVWYPAEKNDLPKTQYMSSQAARSIAKNDLKEIFKAQDSELTFLDTLKTHASENAPITTSKSRYPVIIFSPGNGAPINIYSVFIEELASHGYVVFGINYPYMSSPVVFPDHGENQEILKRVQDDTGRRIIKKMPMEELKKIWGVATDDEVATHEQKLWVQDIQFVLDRLANINAHDPNNILAGKLDLNHIGLAGHSFGGGASIQTCALDARCKAVANIDGRFSYNADFDHGFNKPTLFIRNPYHKQDKKEQLLEQLKTMQFPAEFHEIPKMLHSSFSDIMLFITEPDPKTRPVDVLAGLQKTCKLLLIFFKTHLNGL